MNASEALTRLQAGNGRFVAGQTTRDPQTAPQNRRELADGQAPFAVILSCADSRVPPELVFDADLGELFVVRVAGNVLDPIVLGSIEFAVTALGTRLLVVLGHSACGAIEAALGQIAEPSADLSPHLQALVAALRPAVAPVVAANPQLAPMALHAEAVTANVVAVAGALERECTKWLGEETRERLPALVVGAEYDLGSGVVHFYEP